MPDPLPSKRKANDLQTSRSKPLANKKVKGAEVDSRVDLPASQPTQSVMAGTKAATPKVSKKSGKSVNPHKTQARFVEGSQLMQMSVRAEDDKLFETESSAAESEDDDEFNHSGVERLHEHEVYPSDAEDAIPNEKEQGEIVEQDDLNDQTDKVPANQQMEEIEQEIQQKILELHDKMEESGMHSAVNLIEKLFDQRPGDDKEQKRKLKAKYRRGMQGKSTELEQNMNGNRATARNPLFQPTCNTSDETLYRNAVQKCTSSSSEDGLDISDESNLFQNLVLDTSKSAQRTQPLPVTPQAEVRARQHSHRDRRDKPQPSTSRWEESDPEEQAADLIRCSEQQKATTFPPTGEIIKFSTDRDRFAFVAHMDQDYTVVGAHVDDSTQQKIANGQYVDFSKLLPKDKILAEEEGNHMELVIKQGKTYWMPVSETSTINNFNKWEQAFRVYSNIYTRTNPTRAGELIEYNHVIHSISLSFTWENVYDYDKDFRLHLAKHPQCSWAIILQQAWSMRLRDRVRHDTPNNRQQYQAQQTGDNSFSKSKSPINDYCRRFNKGKCNLGQECSFEHRCTYCHKFGHGVIVCHKLMFDKEKSKKNAGRHNNGGKHHSHRGHSHMPKGSKSD